MASSELKAEASQRPPSCLGARSRRAISPTPCSQPTGSRKFESPEARQLRLSALRLPFVTRALLNPRQSASLDLARLPALPVSGTMWLCNTNGTTAKPPKIFASMMWILRMPLLPSNIRTVSKRSTAGSSMARSVFRSIGMAHNKVLFVVVTLPGEDTCRIISARKATRHEQDRYYAGDRETW